MQQTQPQCLDSCKFQQIITRKFTKQTGIKIQRQYHRKLDPFLETSKKPEKNRELISKKKFYYKKVVFLI